MANRNTQNGGTDWAYGEAPVGSTDMNDTNNAILDYVDTQDVGFVDSKYTGTDFNVTVSAGTGTTSNSHTIQIASGDLSDFNYLLIYASVESDILSTISATTRDNYTNFKVEHQETGGGSFTTVFDARLGRFYNNSGATTNSGASRHTFTNVICIELSASEKADGIDIKFTGSCTVTGVVGGASSYCKITNDNIFFTGVR